MGQWVNDAVPVNALSLTGVTARDVTLFLPAGLDLDRMPYAVYRV